MADEQARLAVAERAAAAGGAVAEDAFRTGIAVETKRHKVDSVTQADRDAQARVIEVIRETYPDDTVVGEEEGAEKVVPDEGAAWVVDPIDGTNNYVRGNPLWATAVASVVDGETVAAATVLPVVGDTYLAAGDGTRHNGTPASVSERADPDTFDVAPGMWWEFDDRDTFAAVCAGIVERFADLRRYGSAQATLAMVATGQLEGVVTNVETNPWDTLAGVHLVRQAGGTVTDARGDPWTVTSTGLVASNGAAHEGLVDVVRDL